MGFRMEKKPESTVEVRIVRPVRPVKMESKMAMKRESTVVVRIALSVMVAQVPVVSIYQML
jgi:hypothetical protein